MTPRGAAIAADLSAVATGGLVPRGTFGELAVRHCVSRQRVQQVAGRLGLVAAPQQRTPSRTAAPRACAACGRAAVTGKGKYCQGCRTVTQPCATCGAPVTVRRAHWQRTQRDTRYRGRLFCNRRCFGAYAGTHYGWPVHRKGGGRPLQTHCKRGHELSPGNLYSWRTPNGYLLRQCRACQLAGKRARYAARLEERR